MLLMTTFTIYNINNIKANTVLNQLLINIIIAIMRV